MTDSIETSEDEAMPWVPPVATVDTNAMSKTLPPLPEREAFEAQFPIPHGVTWSGSEYVVHESYINSYKCDRFVGQWQAWKCRAAIEAQGVPDVVVLQIDAAVTQAQKVISDWNEWYGMHGGNAPIPPSGIVKAQELLAVAKSLLASAPPAPQAAVVQQEPAAWVDERVIQWLASRPSSARTNITTKLAAAKCPERPMPLYTHPAPQAKQPLTDEQRQDIASIRKAEQWMFLTDFPVPSDVYAALAQAIDNLEAAHGIKGE